MFKAKIIILVVLSVLFSGCYSEKILRTKPTTFIKSKEKEINTNNLQYHCIDYEENKLDDDKNKSIMCSGYTSLSIQNIKDVYKNNKDTMINDLLYVSDQNCKKFVEKFKYNFMKQSVTNKFLGLNLFGVGFNIGGVAQLTNEEFVQLSDTLNNNLNERKKFKETTLKSKEESNKTIEALLLDFMEYDRKCSLITTF